MRKKVWSSENQVRGCWYQRRREIRAWDQVVFRRDGEEA